MVVNAFDEDSGQTVDEEVDNLGVKAALCILTFYKSDYFVLFCIEVMSLQMYSCIN